MNRRTFFVMNNNNLKNQNNKNLMRDDHSSHQGHINGHISNFISGLLAGVISVTVCNPLDIARTRLNVLNAPKHHSPNPKYTHFTHAMKTIWKQEGWRGFYSGYRTNIIAIPLFHSLFFPIYEYAKEAIHQAGYNKGQACLAATVTAGSICNIVTNPIWVVRTRLMAQYLHHKDYHYETTAPFTVMREIYKTEGIKSLFRGVTASLFTVSNAIIYFQLYQKTKQLIAKQNAVTVTNIFISSTFSKIMASIMTYPFTVVRTVMYDFRGKQKASIVNIIKFIFKQNGVAGFYSGLKPDLIRLIPSNAITFIIYEKMKQLL